MHRVPFWPEELGEVFARMDATFYRQIDEEREFLARGEQQHLIGMAHFWWTQQGEAYVAHLTLLITLSCYSKLRDITDMKTDIIARNTRSPFVHTREPIHYLTTSCSSERSASMSRQNTALSEEQQAKLIVLLNRRLADAIDLQLQSRQAYWNVKGPHFMALRELFDKVARGVEEYASLIAERIVQLGCKAEGTVQAVAGRSSPAEDRLATANRNGHIDALSTTLTAFGKHARYASEQTTELKDTDTADIFTEIARGIDKLLWFVETSQQGES